jgi:outer membrane lipoprotein SlyB
VLDLESITVNGERLSVVSTPERVPAESGKEGVGANKRTGKYVGGGAIGAIIGAVAGGGKGAAIGAATGAGAGAVGQTVTRGHKVRLPVESLISFRLDRELNVTAPIVAP